MSSKTKRDASPAPISASKLSLGKLTGRQNPTGSISIRFNAATADDDLDEEDLTIVGTIKSPPQEEPSKITEKLVSSSKEAVKVELSRTCNVPVPAPEPINPRAAVAPTTLTTTERSKSAPPSELNTPLLGEPPGGPPLIPSLITDRLLGKGASSPTDLTPSEDAEQRSLLAGIRERFQDRIPEPLSHLIDKFSGENSPEEKERKLKKSESLDSARSDLFNAEKVKKDLIEQNKAKSHSRNASTASVESNTSQQNGQPETSSSNAGEKLEKCKASSFEIVEDFYEAEPIEDFTGGITFSGTKRSSSSDQISRSSTSSKPKSKLQRWMGSLDKGTPGQKSVSMTLSGLLSNKEEELEYMDDEFFDPEESLPTTKDDSSKREVKPPAEKLPPPGNKLPSRSTGSGLPFHRLLSATVLLFAYLIIPLPAFIDGLCVGMAITLGVVKFYYWWIAPPAVRPPMVLPRLDELPPLKVPEMKESKNEDGKFKVWMNELYQYNPDDYHINKTHSVYVQLEGTSLRLQRPKLNIAKRAMWDEKTIPTPTFIHQRHFDLVGSHISLVPPGLVKKRMWSKKYPICVVLAKTGSKIEHKLKKEGSTENELAKGMGYEVIAPEVCEDSVLFLFGRTGREKETWFRRLDAASRGDPLPTRITDLVPLPTKTSDTDQLEASNSDFEIGIDVAAKLPKRNSTPNLVRQSTPPLGSSPTSSSIRHRRQDSSDSISSIQSEPVKENTLPPPPPAPSEILLTEYIHYMGGIMPAVIGEEETPNLTNNSSGRKSSASSPTTSSPVTKTSIKEKDKESEKSASKQKKDKEKDATSSVVPSPRPSCEANVLWLNAVLGRCIWDFLRESYWAERMQERIQRKLSKIHVPYMIDELTVTEIEMGGELPVIRRISRPYIDDTGLWVDLDVAYNGGFQMSLETKVNLMKLKKSNSNSSEGGEGRLAIEKRYEMRSWHKSPVTDSEEEDSAESSTDEEADEPMPDSMEERSEPGRSTSRKLLRLVDKITQSKYFQQATEYKYIKRAMEEVSNTPLQLTVELRSVSGTLAVNIPPPPTDRIWYGFRTNPKVSLLAKPKVGQREVTVTHITDWIEKKLQIEFQRIFVMPNMDDLPVPIMSDHLNAYTNDAPS